MSPDLAARKVIVSCYLYYNISSPAISAMMDFVVASMYDYVEFQGYLGNIG